MFAVGEELDFKKVVNMLGLCTNITASMFLLAVVSSANRYINNFQLRNYILNYFQKHVTFVILIRRAFSQFFQIQYPQDDGSCGLAQVLALLPKEGNYHRCKS